VEVLGLSGVPVAGDEFDVVQDEKAAKEVAEHRALKARQKELGTVRKATLEDLFAKAKESGQKVLNVVVKADVQGSAEAVSQALEKAATKKVGVKILDSGVGAITESDVLTATAGGGAIIVGFNTKPETKVDQMASQQGVKILLFDVIYEAVDKVREEMAGLLEPIVKEKPLGKAEVRALFNIPRIGVIAGCGVTEGVVKRTGHVRVLRDRKVIHTGKLSSLKRVKEDVREVATGYECGIGIEGFGDVKPGDVLEVFELEEIRPSLD
jgi:translation initiation factor IF-2